MSNRSASSFTGTFIERSKACGRSSLAGGKKDANILVFVRMPHTSRMLQPFIGVD